MTIFYPYATSSVRGRGRVLLYIVNTASVRDITYEDATSVRDIDNAASVRDIACENAASVYDIAYEDAASDAYCKHHTK